VLARYREGHGARRHRTSRDTRDVFVPTTRDEIHVARRWINRAHERQRINSMPRILAVALLTLSACVGQAPPVRLAGTPPAPSAPSGARVEAPLRKLTRSQYHRAVLDLFAPLGWTESPASRFPADERAGPFATNVIALPTPLDVDLTFAAAESLANKAAPQAEKLTGCQQLTAECARNALHVFARRAWRRPLTDPERTGLDALFEGRDAREAFTLALTAVLASPNFLDVVETGHEQLTGFEVATRLGLLLRGSIPDDALLEAAERGELDTAEGVAAQTWRLLREDRSVATLNAFHLQWLHLEDAPEKSPQRYPFWSADVHDATAAETSLFLDTVVRRSDGRFETLLTAPFTFVPSPVERIYGLEPTLPGVMVGLDASQRGGLLTQPLFLAKHANPKWTSPTQRGVVLTRDVLCMPLGSPPPNVNLEPIGVDATGQLTRRQLVEQHSTNPGCAGCHRMFDPVGLAFEHYDAVGAWREPDLADGTRIDSTVAIALGDPELDGPVSSATELIKRLAKSKVARSCYVTQWYRFSLGRLETAADQPELSALQKRFLESDGTIPDLIVAITTSDAFRSRAP
jgi:hypothetical protein